MLLLHVPLYRNIRQSIKISLTMSSPLALTFCNKNNYSTKDKRVDNCFILFWLQEPLTEQDIIDALPVKDMTLDIIIVTKILSDRGTNALGDFEVQYMYDPRGTKPVEKWEWLPENLFSLRTCVCNCLAQASVNCRYM